MRKTLTHVSYNDYSTKYEKQNLDIVLMPII